MSFDMQLREMADGDLPIFFTQQMDPAAVQMVAFTAREPTDREAFMAHWAKIRIAEGGTIRTILFAERVAGYVASFQRQGKTEVCYVLGKEFWGKGIATRALSEFLGKLKTRPLYAGVANDNIGSLRVLEKCGFEIVSREKSFAQARGEEIEEFVLRLGE